MSYLTSSNLISANLRNRDNSSNQESSLGFPEHIPFSSMSLSLGTKSTTLGQSNLDSLGSALNHPRKFTTYAERMSTNLAFSDGTSLSVGSPKTKKTGAETREELLNSLLSRTNTLSAIEQRTLPYVNTRQAFTPEQINEACYVDINSNKAVFDSLRNNPKVNYDGRCFAYKSKHALEDKNQLLILIRKSPEGIAVIDLKDAYPTVMEDLQALKAAGQIWLLSNFDSQEDIAYPNDPRVPIKVDDDLKLLFRGIELPRDMIDIEKNLQKNGMKPATNTAKI
ncbi:unnamed protein product [Camellia sinensis]